MAFIVDVFLSSTFEDLKKYADAVYERLNRHEMFRCTHQRDFGARDATAVDYCRERVLKAELYVGVFGMRRGWEPKGDDRKRSITEMEHDWAKESARSRFLYVTPAGFPVPGDKPEPIAMHRRQLAFRKKVMDEGERLVSQRGFESPELLAAEIESKLVLHVATSNLINRFRPELSAQSRVAHEERRPAIAAAVERLADDKDVDLLALAKNPGDVDLADLESKLKTRAETHEAEGQSSIRASAKYWRHIGALAFLHDTQKAFGAYEKAVQLDPLEPEGWRYLGELQFRLGDLANAERSFARLLELGKSTGDLRTQSLGCGRLGWISQNHGDLTTAEALATDAVRFAEAAAWPEGVARVYGLLGSIHQTRSDLDKAEEMYRKSLKLSEEIGSSDGMAAAYGSLGDIHQTRGDLDKAEEMYLAALKLNEKLGDKEGMARDHGSLGNIHLIHDDLSKAEEMYRKSLTLCEDLGSKEGMAHAYLCLGNIHHARGDIDKAEEMYRKSLTLDEELGHKRAMAAVYGNLGTICQIRGDIDKAEEMYRRSLALDKELGGKEYSATAYINLGIIRRDRGDLDQAEEMQRKALTLYMELGGKRGMAQTYLQLGFIHHGRGDLAQAEDMYRKSLALHEALDSKEGMALAYVNLGTIHQIGDSEKARQMYRKSLALYEELGRKEGMATVYGKLGFIYLGDKAVMCESWRKARDIYREIGLPNKVAEVEEWLKLNECGDS